MSPLLALPPTPAPPVDYAYTASVLHVLDGDTYVLDIDLGFYVHTIQHVRLLGANCPELPTPAGKSAAAFVTDLFARMGGPLIVQSRKDPARSFERYVAAIWLPDGRALADVLVAAGQAVRI